MYQFRVIFILTFLSLLTCSLGACAQNQQSLEGHKTYKQDVKKRKGKQTKTMEITKDSIFVIQLDQHNIVCSIEQNTVKEIVRIPHIKGRAKSTVVQNKLIYFFDEQVTVYNLKGEQVYQFDYLKKPYYLYSYGPLVIMGGRFQKDAETYNLAYIDVSRDPQKIIYIPTPNHGKGKLSIDDIVLHGDKIIMYANRFSNNTHWVNFVIKDSGEIQFVNIEATEKNLIYNNISEIQANRDYMAFMSSASSSSVNLIESYLRIRGKSNGFLSARIKYTEKNSSRNNPNNNNYPDLFDDFCLAGDHLYIIWNENIYFLDLNKKIEKEAMIKIPKKLKFGQRIYGTPTGHALIITGDQYELIKHP